MLTAEKARELFNYDPESGLLTWAVKVQWRVPAGSEVGHLHKTGYIAVKTNYRIYYAHRIIWLIVHGEWPIQIDHINGVRNDNRIVNLRNVTHQENVKNRRLPRNNTSGCIGVGWHTQYKCWQARITVDDKLKHLGYFDSKELAIEARKQAEKENGYHPNHGRLPLTPLGVSK